MSATSALFERLLRVDTDAWNAVIRGGISGTSGVTKDALLGEVQRTMESVVLGLDNGSMTQRVQLVTRIEAA